MRILIDCDVLLDVCLARDPHFEHSAAVLRWAELHPGKAAVAWHTCSNLAYLARGNLARTFLRELLEFIVIPPLDTESLQRALGFAIPDLEDAMQAVAAEKFSALRIVTRNLSHFSKSPVPAVHPRELLTILHSK
ncbi:hypothetical protein EBX31_10095 [bacterium]|nr:hypothetical protein [bacterium]